MTTLPDWNLEKPTEAAIVAELGRALGAESADALWSVVCRQLGVDQQVTDVNDLIRACEALVLLGEIARVTGRSGKVRALTYRALFDALPARPALPAGTIRG